MQIPRLWFADSSKSLGLRCSGPSSPPVQTSVKKGYKLTGELNAQSKSAVVKKNKEIFSSVLEVITVPDINWEPVAVGNTP